MCKLLENAVLITVVWDCISATLFEVPWWKDVALSLGSP